PAECRGALRRRARGRNPSAARHLPGGGARPATGQARPVKLPPRSVERFLGAPDSTITAVLLFGPDIGLVRERADRLTRAVAGDAADPFRVSELTAASLREEPTRLLDEANALSLAGGGRGGRGPGGTGRPRPRGLPPLAAG